MIEQKLKIILGEYVFNIAALQAQVEQLQQEIDKLNADKPQRSKAN